MGAQKLIPTKFLYAQGAQKLICAIFSTLLRTKGAQKLVRAEFSTNEVVLTDSTIKIPIQQFIQLLVIFTYPRLTNIQIFYKILFTVSLGREPSVAS